MAKKLEESLRNATTTFERPPKPSLSVQRLKMHKVNVCVRERE